MLIEDSTDRIDRSGQRWDEGRLMSETISDHSNQQLLRASSDITNLSRHHQDEHYVVMLFLWYLHTGSTAVTFLCAKVHFHGGVSPGVQDLPGNDADDRHPERHREERGGLMTALPRSICCSCSWKYSSELWNKENNGQIRLNTQNNLWGETRNNTTADSLWQSKLVTEDLGRVCSYSAVSGSRLQ